MIGSIFWVSTQVSNSRLALQCFVWCTKPSTDESSLSEYLLETLCDTEDLPYTNPGVLLNMLYRWSSNGIERMRSTSSAVTWSSRIIASNTFRMLSLWGCVSVFFILSGYAGSLSFRSICLSEKESDRVTIVFCKSLGQWKWCRKKVLEWPRISVFWNEHLSRLIKIKKSLFIELVEMERPPSSLWSRSLLSYLVCIDGYSFTRTCSMESSLPRITIGLDILLATVWHTTRLEVEAMRARDSNSIIIAKHYRQPPINPRRDSSSQFCDSLFSIIRKAKWEIWFDINTIDDKLWHTEK